MPRRSRLENPVAATDVVASSRLEEVREISLRVTIIHSEPPPPSPTWLGRGLLFLARSLGSLQLAIGLLVFFTITLAVGTVVESWYSAGLARELVYGTWWFAVLLALLWVNILFAALKKWPWKKQQTGFLITHLGLLTIVAGGVLTWIAGVDAELFLVDTEHTALQQRFGLPQSSNRATIRDQAVITVQGPGLERGQSFPFQPGSLGWEAYRYPRSQHLLLGFLSVLADPLPRSWRKETGAGVRLEVLAYHPLARKEPVSPAGAGERGFPAVKVELRSREMGKLEGQWLWMNHADRASRPYHEIGPAGIELLGPCPGVLADEFLHPPARTEVGPKGQLVFHCRGRTHRLPVEGNLGRWIRIDKGVSLRPWRYLAHIGMDEPDAAPRDPGLEFDLEDNGRVSRWRATARATARNGLFAGEPPREMPVVWYHPPDFNYGAGERRRGLLQFAQVGDELLFRSFSTAIGGFQLEKSGPIQAQEPCGIWQGMGWTFEIAEHLPRAVLQRRIVPVDARPGLDKPGLSPAIECRISVGNEDAKFSIGLDDTRALTVGRETFQVTFCRELKELPFALTLLKAEQTVDPGTQQPASFASTVRVSRSDERSGDERIITMNQPLALAGYRVYQANYGLLTWDAGQRPVSFSGFIVGRDPGLWLKYAGAIMLALGIGCMFYMKAYFFAPRRAR